MKLEAVQRINLVYAWNDSPNLTNDKNHNIPPACSVHISSVPPTPPSESCPACIVPQRAGVRVGFININDMYNNDVGKGVVYD